MVVVENVTRLSERRRQTSSAQFLEEALKTIRASVEQVPDSLFEGTTKAREISAFDAQIAENLQGYEYEGSRKGGYNPNCKLWKHLGFDYSVDLYHGDERIAIEVEKSERKSISDDLLKFQKGYRTKEDGRPKIEFGCLVVPVNYRGSDNLYQHTLAKLDFMKGVLFIDDIGVIGYRIPTME